MCDLTDLDLQTDCDAVGLCCVVDERCVVASRGDVLLLADVMLELSDDVSAASAGTTTTHFTLPATPLA